MTDGPVDEPSWSVSVEETPWTVIVDDAATTTVVIEETPPAEVSVAASGPQGPRGTQVLSGSGAPDGGIGILGDFYLDLDVSRLYGPKTSESWELSRSLVGLARDSVYFSRSGALSVVSGIVSPWRANTPWNVTDVTVSVLVAPVGQDVQVDVRRIRGATDVSIFPEDVYAVIQAGETTGTVDTFEASNNELEVSDYLYASIVQVGTTTPGTGLLVQVDLQEPA
jgi:hypothetical protein